MNTGQLISGLVLTIIGAILLVLGIVHGFGGGNFMLWIYGIPSLILGIAILFYKNEDKIEQIKSRIERNKNRPSVVDLRRQKND